MGDKTRQCWEPEIWARPLSATCARAAKLRRIYRNSNGDRWQLIRGMVLGRSFLRREPNSHPAGEPRIRMSRSFLTELAPALRSSRCGRSWMAKPDGQELVSGANREALTRPGDNSPHDPQFLVCRQEARWRALHVRRFMSGSARFGVGCLADVVGLCLSGYPAQII